MRRSAGARAALWRRLVHFAAAFSLAAVLVLAYLVHDSAVRGLGGKLSPDALRRHLSSLFFAVHERPFEGLSTVCPLGAAGRVAPAGVTSLGGAGAAVSLRQASARRAAVEMAAPLMHWAYSGDLPEQAGSAEAQSKTAAAALLARGQKRFVAPDFTRFRVLRTAVPLLRAARERAHAGVPEPVRSFPPRVLLFIGASFAWGYNGGRGGNAALGELTQWSDLFAALVALGADVSIVWRREDLPAVYCALVGGAFNAIFSDYVGAWTLDEAVGEALGGLSLEAVSEERAQRGAQMQGGLIAELDRKLWVLDFFGTDKVQNLMPWTEGRKSPWSLFCCRWLPQHRFLTAHDRFGGGSGNSFLGQIVEAPPADASGSMPLAERSRTLLIYGKQCRFLDAVPGARAAIAAFQAGGWRVLDTFEARSPEDACQLPAGSEHLGVLPQVEVAGLMSRGARVLLGLGRPLLGPQPLEALAAGMVVVLPRFAAPLDCAHDEELAAKPASCGSLEWTSQHPPLERLEREGLSQLIRFVDYTDSDTLYKLIAELADRPPGPAPARAGGGLLEAFTARAFLTRVAGVLANATATSINASYLAH